MRDDPVLILEGVHNFRDHGGWAVSGGGRLKRGLLWRSGEHADATDADLDKIAALGLANVFDLRSGTERSARPCRRPQGFAGKVHINDDDIRQQAPHVVVAKEAAVRPSTLRSDPATAREGMRLAYQSFPFRPKLVAMIRQYLEVLARGEGPSLINCMAGKDRTGVSVAVLHLAAGVHPDDAIADYVLTNTAGNLEARIAAGTRDWVPWVFIPVGLLGVLWLLVFYVAGNQVPVFRDLQSWNYLIGIGLIASSFVIATFWK